MLDELHIDRDVFETLARWAEAHDISVQDAMQLAICAFNDAQASVDLYDANAISATHEVIADSL